MDNPVVVRYNKNIESPNRITRQGVHLSKNSLHSFPFGCPFFRFGGSSPGTAWV